MYRLLLLLLLAACGTQAPPEPDCSNPRSATDSLFLWQQTDHFDLSKATACTERPVGLDVRRAAQQLKQVLDARGLYVPVASMSEEPDHLNADLDDEGFCVDDDGPGIAPSERDRMLLPFEHGDAGGATGGVGLGLSIVVRSVHRRGGTVELLTAPIGGLRVRIWLPPLAGEA